MRWAPLALAASLAFAHVDTAVASAPPSTEPEAGAVDAVPAPVTVDVLRDMVGSLFAPSGDVLNALTALGIEPHKGVPAPNESFVWNITVALYAQQEMLAGSYEAVVNLAVDAPAAEIVAFYRSAMPGNGFPLVEESTEDIRNDGVATSLNFAAPDISDEDSGLTVGVLDFGAGRYTGVFVSLRGTMTPDMSGLTAWLDGLPLTGEAADITRVTVEAGTDPNDYAIDVTAEFMFEITGRELTDHFEVALVGSPYAIDTEATARPNGFALVGGELDELEVVIDRIGGPGRLTAYGTIDLPG